MILLLSDFPYQETMLNSVYAILVRLCEAPQLFPQCFGSFFVSAVVKRTDLCLGGPHALNVIMILLCRTLVNI